nr:hypothetical protein [Tanacetum cinerariifolium]
KRPLRATTPVEPTDLERTKAEQLKIVLKRSRQETHISQQSGSGTVGSQEEGNESNDDSDDGSDKDSEETVKSGAGKDGDDDDDEDDDDDDEEEETAKDDEELKETGTGGDDVREGEGESEEEKETSEEEEIVSLEPPTPIMTPSTIATITTLGEAPIPPPTIPSIILENLPTFNSAFRFEERLRLLETYFYE